MPLAGYWFPGRKPALENTSERQNREKRKILKKKKLNSGIRVAGEEVLD
jgi:hypothetical protein